MNDPDRIQKAMIVCSKREADGMIVNDKCKSLAKKIKEIIDTKSSFVDWLNNQNVCDQLKLDKKFV